MEKGMGWIGVDLDGTLAEYTRWQGPEHIGAPIPVMVERVKRWLAEGRVVKIFTARIAVTKDAEEPFKARKAIRQWCVQHIGQELSITCLKYFGMIELYDDRVVAVERNTGRLLSHSTCGLDDHVNRSSYGDQGGQS